MYKQITVKTLKQQGKANTQIAEVMHCHRNTVNNILKLKAPREKQIRNKSSYFDLHREKIKEWLDLKFTRLRIYEILKDEYKLVHSYDSMCKYIQKEFPHKPEAFGVQITEPGQEAEVDFGFLGSFPDDTGKMVRIYILIIILAYSRLAYYHLCTDQKIKSLLSGCIKAFEYFDGVPCYLKVDNMRTAVLRNSHYDLQFNQDFLEFGYHYGFVIKPCEPYSPNQKGKVESGVKYIQRNFIPGRTFKSRSDMEKQLRDWTNNYANSRTHGTTKLIPNSVFQNIEKVKLQPLPENEFRFFTSATRTVMRNCHVYFGENFYSVPSSLVGKVVAIRYDENLLRVTSGSEEVALHQLHKGKGQYITVRSHMPQNKYYSETEHQAKYELKMINIGENSHKYFSELLVKKSGYWSITVRAILGLAHTYGNTRVDLSLKRALAFGVLDAPTIRNICEEQTYLLEQPPKLTTIAFADSFSRDPSYYAQVYS